MTTLRTFLLLLILAALIGAPAVGAQPGADYALAGGPASALLTVSGAALSGGEYSLAGQIALGSAAPAYAVPVAPTPVVAPTPGGFSIFLPTVQR